MGKMLPELHSSNVITRYQEGEPVLSKKDIPYPAECIFNAGVAKFNGQYVMAFRNDFNYRAGDGGSGDGGGSGGGFGGGFGGCVIGVAFSEDGIHWNVREEPFLTVSDMNDPDVTRVYDPRLTVIGSRCYLCFAVDTRHGVRGGIAVTDDFKSVEVLSLTVPDNRNMVLFPEMVNGRYVRLERPFPVYSRGGIDRFDTWISFSKNLVYWGDSRLLLPVENVAWANDKTGPGAPPIKTEAGWLTLFHGVDLDTTRGKNGWESSWKKRYCAGIMLLDLDDPTKIIGMSQKPLLAPETAYETELGYRTNVIFPGGMILEDDGEVKIYYGASDTVECLATARVEELVALCRE